VLLILCFLFIFARVFHVLSSSRGLVNISKSIGIDPYNNANDNCLSRSTSRECLLKSLRLPVWVPRLWNGHERLLTSPFPPSSLGLCIGLFHAALPLIFPIAVHPYPRSRLPIFNSAWKWPLVNLVSHDSEVISFDLYFRKDVKTDADDISLLSNF